MTKSFARRATNRLLALVARFAPGATSLRPFLHRLRGVRISGRVFIGEDVYLENEYPECIELHDGAQIALRSILIAHTRGPGRIVIEKDVFVGANALISAPFGETVTIGEGSVIVASSVVSSSVPSHTLFGNQKARALGRVTVPLRMDTSYRQFISGLRPLSKQ